MGDRVRIPRWASAIWGGILAVLNIFLVLYILAFSSFAFTFGSGNPSLFERYLLDEQAFGGMFSIVAVAVSLSFLFMGMSLVHLLAWSDIPNEKKLVWAAALFAGAQPAALAYWYLHVWREGKTAKASGVARHRGSAENRVWIVVLGALTLVPPLYFVGFFGLVGFGIAGGGFVDAEPLFRVLPAAHMGVILLWYVLMAVYLIDVFRNPRLDGNGRALWAVIIAFAGPLGWPIYWYMNLWRAAPETAVAPVAGELQER